MCALFATLLLGGLLGYTTAGGFREQPAPNPKDTTENVSEADASVETMTEEDAKAFVIEAKEKLKRDDTSFEEIEDYYRRYSDNREFIRSVAPEDYELIEAYHTLVDDIKGGKYDEIKLKSTNAGSPCFFISDDHLKIVQKLDKGKFEENYVDVQSLKDLKKLCGKASETPAPASKQTCTRCLQNVDNPKEHIKKCKKYACHKCGAGMNFNTEGELKNHMKTKHGVGSNSGNNSGAPQTIQQQAEEEL
jgi:hypothetical protein